MHGADQARQAYGGAETVLATETQEAVIPDLSFTHPVHRQHHEVVS